MTSFFTTIFKVIRSVLLIATALLVGCFIACFMLMDALDSHTVSNTDASKP